MATMRCLPMEDLAAYADGSLVEDRASELERHLSACPECEGRLSDVERSGQVRGVMKAMRGLAASPSHDSSTRSNACKTVVAETTSKATGPLEYARIATDAESEPSGTVDAPRAKKTTPPDDFDLTRGPVEFGRYALEKKLGEGGMGAVFLATDSVLGRKVAIKIPFLSSRREREELLKRFRREARCAAALDHPNICGVFDVGEIDGRPYMAMAYVPGRPLSDFIKAKAEIPVKIALQVAQRLAKTLDYAHSRGVLHRDLKPSNIQFSDRKEPVVMDFGLARLEADHKAEPLTRSGDVVGTPAYMPPEQLGGRHDQMGPWSDVYSLGVILYQLLTKRRPFDGELFELMNKIAHEQAAPPSIHREEIAPYIDALVLRCLEKSPRTRFQSMAEFAQAIGECLKALEHGGSPASGPEVAMPTVDSSRAGTLAGDSPTSSTDPSTVRFSKPPLPGALAGGLVSTTPHETPQGARPTPLPTEVPNPFAAIAEAERAATTVIPTVQAPTEASSPTELDSERAAPPKSLARRPRSAASGAPSVAVRPPSRTARGLGRPPWLRRPLTWAGAVGAVLLLGVVFFLPTGKGTLRVELNDPTFEVRIKGTEIVLTGADPEPVRLRPGEKTLIVKRGDFEFETKSLTLRKNDTVTAVVELLDGVVRVVADDREIGRDSVGEVAPPTQPATKASNLSGGAVPSVPAWIATPEFKAWMDDVARKTPAEQVKAVSMKMKELNPGFDGEMRARFDVDGRVEGVDFSGNVNGTVKFVVDVSALQGLSTMTRVGMEGARVADLAPLRGMKLTMLGAGYTQVVDLSPLSGMPLEDLNVWHTKVSSLRPLAGMKLKSLAIDACPIADLAPLEGMPLVVLQAAGARVESLLPLKGMPLRNLSVTGTFSDISPLKGMALKSVSLGSFHVSDFSPIAECPLTDVWCHFSFPRDAALLRSFKTLTTINGKPAAEFLKEFDSKPAITPKSLSTGWHGWPADAPKPAIAPFDTAQARKHQEEWAAYLKVPVEHTNSIGMKFRLIPPGEYDRGSSPEQVAQAVAAATRDQQDPGAIERIRVGEQPQRRIVITRPFWLGATEVTIGQFKKFVAATGHVTLVESLNRKASTSGSQAAKPLPTYLEPGYAVGDDHPAVCVTWNDALAFCRWRPPSQDVECRLPTEAEWEYACRAGTTTQFWFGDDPADVEKYGWILDNALGKAHPVGGKPSNPFGLFDTAGNVYEWCADEYRGEDWMTSYAEENTVDPSVVQKIARDRVLRGGSWAYKRAIARSAARFVIWNFLASPEAGFRVAMSIAPKERQPEAPPRPSVSTPVAPPEFPNDPERAATAWAVGRKGTVTAQLEKGNAVITRLSEIPAEGRFRVLKVSILTQPIKDDELKVLARLKAIQELTLADCRELTDAGVSHLAPLTSLIRLDVSGSAIRGECLERLDKLTALIFLSVARTPIEDFALRHVAAFSLLEGLDLSYTTKISPAAIVSLPPLEKLRVLNLGRRSVTVEMLKATSRYPLSWLSLEHSTVTDEMLGALDAPNLGELLLGSTSIGDSGLDFASRSPRLKALNAGNSAIGDAGLRRLESLTDLERLTLNSTKVTDRGLQSLGKLPKLNELHLNQLGLTGEGLAALKSLPLQTLHLAGARPTEAGIRSLAEIRTLRRLTLSGTPLNDAGLKLLSGLTKLEVLDVSKTQVTAAGVTALNTVLPKCQVVWDGDNVGTPAASSP